MNTYTHTSCGRCNGRKSEVEEKYRCNARKRSLTHTYTLLTARVNQEIYRLIAFRISSNSLLNREHCTQQHTPLRRASGAATASYNTSSSTYPWGREPSRSLECNSICFPFHETAANADAVEAASLQICAMCIQFVFCLHYYTLKHEVPMTASCVCSNLSRCRCRRRRHSKQGKPFRIHDLPNYAQTMRFAEWLLCRIPIRYSDILPASGVSFLHSFRQHSTVR